MSASNKTGPYHPVHLSVNTMASRFIVDILQSITKCLEGWLLRMDRIGI